MRYFDILLVHKSIYNHNILRNGEILNSAHSGNAEVKKVNGDTDKKCISSIEVLNNKTKAQKEVKIDGFFVAIGHAPATSLFKTKLKMDDDGYIITSPDSTKTNVDGVFAAGDVTDKIYRQAVTAAGMGCMSAIEAESFLNLKKII